MADSDLRTKVSKCMSYLLRHNPENLQMDDKGFVRLENLLRKINERFDVNEHFVKQIVCDSEKKRFEIVGEKIRAIYGHSINVEIRLPEDQTVELLYHGTTLESVSKILKDGLKPMRRKWVHLSTTEETAKEVGKRRTPNPVVLAIDAQKARKDGIKFYKATGGVYLSKEIPSKYIKILDQHFFHAKP